MGTSKEVIGNKLYKALTKNNFQRKLALVAPIVIFCALYAIQYFWYLPFKQTHPYWDDLELMGMTLPLSYGEAMVSSSVHFRPVFYLITRFLVGVFGFRMAAYYVLNLTVHVLIAVFLYIAARKITGRQWIAFIVPVLYLFSSFALYGVIEVFGLMELICLLLTVLIFYSFYQIFAGDEKKFCLHVALCVLYYALIIYTHERFIVLGLPICAAFFLQRKKFGSAARFFCFSAGVVLVFLSNVLIKTFALHMVFLGGTGSTTIDFRAATPIRFALYHIAYIFGLHPSQYGYLDGIGREYVDPRIYIAVAVFSLCVIFLFALFLYRTKKAWAKDEEARKESWLFLVYLLAMFVMVASSSFTIRVEQRWVYPPFVAVLFMIALFMRSGFGLDMNQLSEVLRGSLISLLKKCLPAACVLLLASNLAFSVYYHHYWGGIFLDDWNKKGVILHEEYLEKYADLFLEKQIVFISSPDFAIQPYDHAPVLGARWTEMDYILLQRTEVFPKGAINDDAVFVAYDNEKKIFESFDYADIGTTLAASQSKDGFQKEGDFYVVGNTASIFVRSGTRGEIRLSGFLPEFSYPNNLTVFFNGRELGSQQISDNPFALVFDGAEASCAGFLTLNFERAAVPSQLGINEDLRSISAYLSEIVLD